MNCTAFMFIIMHRFGVLLAIEGNECTLSPLSLLSREGYDCDQLQSGNNMTRKVVST